MKILNLTMYPASSCSLEVGVVDAPAGVRGEILKLLSFATLPQWEELERRARKLAQIAADQGARYALIDGESILLGPLTTALYRRGIRVRWEGIVATEPEGE